MLPCCFVLVLLQAVVLVLLLLLLLLFTSGMRNGRGTRMQVLLDTSGAATTSIQVIAAVVVLFASHI